MDPAPIEDALIGCGYPEGATGNIGRQAVIRAGLPFVSVGGATINRYCASGLQAIASAAARIVMDGAPAIAGGVECVADPHPRRRRQRSGSVAAGAQARAVSAHDRDRRHRRRPLRHQPRGAGRYAAQSQQRAEAAQAAGRYREEIIPVTTVMAVTDRATGAVSEREVTVDRDTCNRPGTTYEVLAGPAGARGRPVRHRRQCLAAVRRRGRLRADGSGRGPPRRHRALGVFRGWPSPAASPTRWASARPCRAKTAGAAWLEGGRHRPVGAERSLASQVLYCQQRLGIPMERLNVNGGAIALGHPSASPGAAGRPCAAGRSPPGRAVRGGHDVWAAAWRAGLFEM